MADTESFADRGAIHQCLFGYRDGHRLLAASRVLPQDITSQLLVLSDLAPGLSGIRFESYWTGIPLVKAQIYALMRTWPAPENPRPGCVWTHTLLVTFQELERTPDLTAIGAMPQRPLPNGDLSAYRVPLSLADASSAEVRRSITPGLAAWAIRSIYRTRSNRRLYAEGEGQNAAILAAWSQQWPRLRQTFSFRTLTSGTDISANRSFTLRLVHAPAEMPNLEQDALEVEGWESSAIDDLLSRAPTPFRRFLWRYGSDLSRPEHYRALARAFLSTLQEDLTGQALEQVIAQVSRDLPRPSEGVLLKVDLLPVFDTDRDSLLPRIDELESLSVLVHHPEFRGFVLPDSGTIRTIVEMHWRNRLDALVELAESSLELESTLSASLVDALALAAEPQGLLELTRERLRLRRALIAANPRVLDTNYVEKAPWSEITPLLDAVPDDPRAARALLRLLRRPELDPALVARLPTASFHAFAELMRDQRHSHVGLIPEPLLRAVRNRASAFMESGFVESAESTRILAAYASALDHDSPEVLHFGPAPWSAALKRAIDDVRGRDRDIFLAFLLALALAHRGVSSEFLFEKTFGPIHEKLARSALSPAAKTILSRQLPELGWWGQWDYCLRLRLAVVTAYVDGHLDPASFARLTTAPDLREKLIQLAEQTEEGRSFATRLGVSMPSSEATRGRR